MAIKQLGRVYRTVAVGAVGAAALSALLLPAVPAAAQTVAVAGIGQIDLPDDIPVPDDIPGVDVDPATAAPAPAPGLLPPPFAPFLPPPPPPAETPGQRAVDAAMSKIGAPYSWGATGPDSFDCSGLVQWSYEQAGVDVPRTSYEQEGAGDPVSLDDLQPGDVVTFYGGSHSGIYVGDGNVVHASDYGQPVDVAPLYSMPVTGARRF
ncbi:NlpC/P60 family protein [Nocardia sp. alder85J]|uniref:NlpC/P60 family protein n=1 Tax=Nocardia sp. alder85J TaxID=2862949 RepID=UPI001CD491C2|nr:NlpC/P60 family protein [Nocardia sp. alder85J]MCX4098731.1 NlpC/P60 family protein [Nocardia sp. alder85J]